MKNAPHESRPVLILTEDQNELDRVAELLKPHGYQLSPADPVPQSLSSGLETLEQLSSHESAARQKCVPGLLLRDKPDTEVGVANQDEGYRVLFESHPLPMYICDESTLEFLAVNDAAVRHYGYSRAEFLRMTILDIRPPEEAARVMAYVKSAAGPHDNAGTWKHRTKYGTMIDVEVNWHRIRFAGRPCFLVMANDVTAKRQAEAAIKESEERYRELFENANDIIYTHDLKGYFTSLNKTGERITGYSREEALRMNVTDVLAPNSVDRVREMLGTKQAHHTPTVYELDIFSKAGRLITLEVSTRLIFHEGKPIGVQGIARDTTERRLAKEAFAQQAERTAVTNRISQAVRRTLDLSEVFETAVHELGTHLEVDRCSLFMKNGTFGRVLNVAEYHVAGVGSAGKDFDFPQVQGLNAGVEKHGVLAFDDAANDSRITDLYESILKQFNVKSIMYVGVRVGDELLGAFALSTTRVHRHWSAADIELAKAVADQTGIAIRQARLYQKAEATSLREALVNKLSAAIRASLQLTSMLDTAARELGHELSAALVAVRLYESNSERLSVERAYVERGSEDLRCDEPYYELIRQQLLRSTKPLVIPNAQAFSETGPSFAEFVRVHENHSVQPQINYPLIANGQLRGMISIHHGRPLRNWTEDEILLVGSVASQLTAGVAQAELFEMVTRAKKEWESTFDAMSDGIFIFDRSGELIRVNRAGAAMDNAPPEQLLGKKCCEILRRSSDGDACIVEQAIRNSSSINVEIVPQNLNRPLLITVEPIADERSQTVGVVCTARDLSELRKVEAVARERQSLLENILESAREAIYALDLEGDYQWCNQAMLEMTGYVPEEIIGHKFLERTYEEDRDMRIARFSAAVAGEPQSFESRYLARDGSIRYASVNHAPIIIDGKTTGVLGIAHDITEQKHERERAARADKLRALGQLASGVAHDFNNSLAAILGRTQLLLRRAKDEELIRNLGIIVTAAEDAAATVQRIQTFARKSLGAEQEPLDLAMLLRDATEITRTRWQNEARARGVEIVVTLSSEESMMVQANASELREVFVNLIVNAVDAMPRGGSLKICCKRRGEYARLRFADTGVGMNDDVRERIFEPFYTTKGVHGTGLGLAVSYGIIERHKGVISVDTKPGKGSTFHIDLPLAEKTEYSRPVRSSHVKTPSLSVLVVDDEQFVRETLAEMLTDLEHTVTIAGGGREALEKLNGSKFDLVFTDLAMPEMDGWETARAIRKKRPDVPVILVTGYGATTEPPSGEVDLVSGIIGKPFNFDQVSKTIAKVCGNTNPHP